MREDGEYSEILMGPIRKCADYVPKLGQAGVGLDVDAFSRLYRADPLYSWVGFDSPLMYAAHKAAGGMTSVYRQLGIGCERLFQALLQDAFDLTAEQSAWNYVTPRAGGGEISLSLDGRIDLDDIKNGHARRRVAGWLARMKKLLDVRTEMRGAVFEIRQGYKSKDSKRQNADLANAANAFAQGYFPVLAIFSLQLDGDLRIRYQAAKWGVLIGAAESQDDLSSLYGFFRKVVKYDLAAFFTRNSKAFRSEVESILSALLTPE